MTKALFAFATLLGLSACVDTSSIGSEAYVEGWRMGCYAGYTDGGKTGYWGLAYGTPTHGTSPDYQPAWNEGYTSCFDAAVSDQPTWRTLPDSGSDSSSESAG
jgi:hypothetical protein